MLVKYRPEGDESANKTWEFQPEKVRANRGEMIERRYGARYTEWVKEVQAGQLKARRVLLWHLMNLDVPQFRWEDTPDFMFGELEVDYGVADLQKLRRDVDESAMDDDTKRETLNRLDLEIASRLEKDPHELTPADLGKEPRSESAGSTS